MASKLSPANVQLLKTFIEACKVNSALLHTPELHFFKEWLLSMGANIPDAPKPDTHTKPPPQPAASAEPKADDANDQSESEPESDVELDMTGVIAAETNAPPPMGDDKRAVSEEDEDAADAERGTGMRALADGNWADAVAHLTKAIELNPHSAIFFAKRATALLHEQRPTAAMRDCDRAIELNPDSALAYKNRGRANMLLGHFEKAYVDLAQSCKIDFDETANEWMKHVEPNARKLHDHRRRRELRTAERDEQRRRAERDRRQKEYEQAKSTASAAAADYDDDDDESGMPAGMGNLGGMFSNPEVMNLINDPKVMEALSDPSKMAALAADPKYAPLMKMFAQMGSRMPAGGDPRGGDPMAGAPPPPRKAPEPDID